MMMHRGEMPATMETPTIFRRTQRRHQLQQQKQQQTLQRRLTTSSPSTATHCCNRSYCTDIKCTVVIAVLVGLLLLANNAEARKPKEPYYGRFIDNLKSYAHAIKGAVYAVDESTIFIKSFAYDGLGPDAYFWVGKSMNPSPQGYIIPYPEDYVGGEPPKLRAHNGTDIILRLPMGKRIRDIRWLAVWCRRFTVDFADVMIPASIDVAKPRVLPEFKRLAHGLRSSNISILDAKTFYIPNLHYDGAGPDAYFWVGTGPEPNIMGTKVPNEMGSNDPLRGYQGEDIEIQLPGNLTVYDIDWLAVWCVEYRHNFGHVFIPDNLDVPPALGQTQISTTTTAAPTIVRNCRELLRDRLQIRWELQGENLLVELAGRMREDEYMAFGLSGANGRAQMVQSDIVVAFYDTKSRTFRAEDYYVSSLSQCDGQHGVCPDERIGGRNDVVVVAGDRRHGVTTIKYRRPLQTNDVNDKSVPTDRNVSVIAAIGPLNSRREANAHAKDGHAVNVDDIQIHFSVHAQSHNDCVINLADVVISNEAGPKPWPSRQLTGVQHIRARIGPTGGKRGYTPITQHPSWGIAWWLNDLLIPELYVERGQTYTFEVEGGDRPAQPARYHPFYITDSSEGGYGQKTDNERLLETTYAGVDRDSDEYEVPTAAGRYCEYQHKTIDKADMIDTFEEYVDTLHLSCDPGEPAFLNWTVPIDAPDLLYYQCFTHKNLGWRINVVDAGQTSFQNRNNNGAATIATTATQLMTIMLFSAIPICVLPMVAMRMNVA